ncbi:hypothetical protein Clacol_002325 [Clathrus columnatus]|uniref:Uncharacterized protein n=1 Tax=Clathrus columnatus TaxID=1419009 RepID=A0AAV5A0G5_9AGAM|nr:hypothetical protein Clacol_002325 [Clathrus columnatus]
MSQFIMPDFITHCNYPLKSHPYGDMAGELSAEWYQRAFPNFTPANEKKLAMLLAGKLCGYIYNDADDDHLQASCDLMHLILYYGDVTDDLDTHENKVYADVMMNALRFPHGYRPLHGEKSNSGEEPTLSKLTRQFWLSCLPDAPSGFQTRFVEDINLFLAARHIQAIQRKNRIIPSIEQYMDIRRDSSAYKPLFDFLEYTLEIDIPDEVMDHPVVQALKDCTNDFCTWANDIYSYNKEQACGDTYNLVVLFMKQYGLKLQDAIDVVGDMCFTVLDRFEMYKTQLPSWNDKIDKDIARYINGLENWIVGCLHWGFMSNRYFGTEGLRIKETRVVKLLPRQTKNVGRDDHTSTHNKPLQPRTPLNQQSQQQQPSDAELVEPPSDSISCLAFSPVADFLAVGSWDCSVRIYEVAPNGQSQGKAMYNHEGPVFDVCWTKDGLKVISVGGDKLARAFDLATGQSSQVGVHDAPIKSCRWVDAAGSGYLVTGSWDKTIKYWNLQSPNPIATVSLPERCYSMDVIYPLLVVATAERHIVIIDLNNPQTISKVINSPLKWQTRCVACFPSGNGFAIGSIEGRVAIHYVDEKETSSNFSFRCHRREDTATKKTEIYAVNIILFHKVFGTFITAGSDGGMHTWDKDLRSLVKTLERSPGPITGCGFNHNGTILAYAVSYDWSKGHAGMVPGAPNKILLHLVKEDDVSKKRK